MASLANNPQSNRPPRILGLPGVMFLTGYSRSKIYRLDKRGVLLRAKQVEGSTFGRMARGQCLCPYRVRAGRIPSIRWKTFTLVRLRHRRVLPSSAIRGTRRQRPTLARLACNWAKAKGAKSGGTSADLQLTSMTVMGGKVYLHAPTGKLFLEIGKAPALLAGINITGDDGNV